MTTKRILGVVCFCTATWTYSPAASATEAAPAPAIRLNPFSRLGTSLQRSFWGSNLALQVGGIAVTPLLLASGADTEVHNFWLERSGFAPYTVPGVVGGYFAPL